MNLNTEFVNSIQPIEQMEVLVLRNVEHFPIYGKDFSLPHLTLGLNTRGTAWALYDLHEVEFNENDLAVVMPNHLLNPVRSTDDYSIVLVVVAGPFLEELKKNSLSHDYSKFHLEPACHLTPEQAKVINKTIDLIETISNTTTKELPHRHDLLLYQLDILFELLGVYRNEMDKLQWETREVHLFNQFCDLLAQHNRETHSVADYAAMLHLTPKYFSSVIQKAVGVTAGDWIDQYMTIQIKKVLRSRRELNIQQVCFEFGFKECATFCRYFKRITGKTPSQYRKEG